MTSKRTIKSVEKAMKLIKYIYYNSKETSIQELTNEFEYHRVTVYHLLNTLEKEGFIRKNIDTNNYLPGPEIFNITLNRSEIAEKYFYGAEKIIDEIVEKYNETTAIYIRKNNHALCLMGKEGNNNLKASLKVGEKIPLHATATGKVILAHSNEDEIEEYIHNNGLKSIQKNTIIDKNELYKELENVIKKGYATEFEEYEELINAIAVPIKNNDEKVNAILVVIASVINLNKNNKEKYAKYLKNKAREINELLRGDKN